jgi:hypothetical protein
VLCQAAHHGTLRGVQLGAERGETFHRSLDCGQRAGQIAAFPACHRLAQSCSHLRNHRAGLGPDYYLKFAQIFGQL